MKRQQSVMDSVDSEQDLKSGPSEVRGEPGAALSDSVREVHFPPFERAIQCPGCSRSLLLMISPVHLRVSLHCPDCARPLSALVRREIRKEYPDL